MTARADWSYNNKQLLKPIQMNRFVRLGGGDGQMAESWGLRGELFAPDRWFNGIDRPVWLSPRG